MKNRPRLFVIAAPSGAGKTTLVKALVKRNPELRFSVSYTTRKPRETESHGRDYLFVDEALTPEDGRVHDSDASDHDPVIADLQR